MLTVAEGIETTGQLRELRRFGCDLGQGYLLSRPLEADALARRFGYAERVAGAVAADRARGPPVRCACELRIGMVCPYSLSIPGGVQAQVLGLARELRRQGHEVRVLGAVRRSAARVVRHPARRQPADRRQRVDRAARARPGGRAADDARAARRGVRRDPRARTAGPGSGDDDAHGALGTDRRHVPRRRSLDELSDARAGAASRCSTASTSAVVVSKDALALVQQHLGGEDDDHVLFNGVETAEHPRPPRRLPSTRPAIFFIGRHEERKGLAVLLAGGAHARRSTSTCWVAGDGPDTSRLRIELRAATPRIEWLGRITEAEKLARLRGASVFCAPSLHGESFGVVLVEAMAAGTPVVASALDGYRNVATDGVDAVLVEPGDAPALAAALDAGALRPATRRGAGGQRARDAPTSSSMARLADEYVAIYSRLSSRVTPDPPVH